jgi:hypothetical protein
MARGGKDAREAWHNLGRVLDQTLTEVQSINQSVIDIHFYVHESTAWRTLLNIARNLRNPDIHHLTQAAHDLVAEMGIPLEAYSLIPIIEGGDQNRVWIQGLRGPAGGPCMMAKLWVMEADAIRSKYMIKLSSPNQLLIKLERPQIQVVLRATIKQGEQVDVEPDIKRAFKTFLLEEILREGGAIFVPKATAEGAVNQLPGLVSECPGEPGGEFDIRHPNFSGLRCGRQSG